MPTRRQRRVSELIHRELSMLLMRDVRDPRLAGVTITDVDVTQDLLLARVYFTVMGDADEEKEAVAGLAHAGGFLRSELAGRVQLRHVPELDFQVDKSAEYARRIDELLEQVKESDNPDDEGSDAEQESGPQ
jgi:ribosome-binding factor A